MSTRTTSVISDGGTAYNQASSESPGRSKSDPYTPSIKSTSGTSFDLIILNPEFAFGSPGTLDNPSYTSNASSYGQILIPSLPPR